MAYRMLTHSVNNSYNYVTFFKNLQRTQYIRTLKISPLTENISFCRRTKAITNKLWGATNTSSQKLTRTVLKVGGVLLTGTSCFTLINARLRSSVVFCEERKSFRLGLESENENDQSDLEKFQDVSFPWMEFVNLLLPDIWFLLGAVIAAFGSAVINIQIPLLLGKIVDIITKFTSHPENGSFIDQIKAPAFELIKMYYYQAVLTFMYISLLSMAGEKLAVRLRSCLFESIIKQDIAFFDTHDSGDLVNRLSGDVQDFKSSFKLCVSQGLRSLTQILGCIVSLLYISPKLTGVMVIVLPAVIVAGTFLGSSLRKLSKKAQAQISRATAIANEAISNVRTVRASAMEEKELELYVRELEKSARLNKFLGMAIGMFQALSNLALNGIVLGTLFAGGYLISNSEIRPGDLMSFMVATQTVQRSLTQISLLFGTLVRGLSAGSRVFEYILLQPTMSVAGGATIPQPFLNGHVRFCNVTFAYPSRPQVVLHQFTLDMQPGKVVALVGLSGAGKSTVASLLERFYDVGDGCIQLDGHDLRSIDSTWLRGSVLGYINQEPVLFATTIMENIRYAKPGASDEDVIQAAKIANADEFIRKFPKGYQTKLGERGVTVSGGQKQRIAIARALIKNPTVLILDEATSALDAESERVVQEALEKVIKGRTVLVIAHRLSTIKKADVIAVMVNGVIKEIGNHEELKAKKGFYWNLIKQQDGDFIDEDQHSKKGARTW